MPKALAIPPENSHESLFRLPALLGPSLTILSSHLPESNQAMPLAPKPILLFLMAAIAFTIAAAAPSDSASSFSNEGDSSNSGADSSNGNDSSGASAVATTGGPTDADGFSPEHNAGEALLLQHVVRDGWSRLWSQVC